MSYDFVGRILKKRRHKIVLAYIKGKLLDIGCGTNLFLKLYKGKTTGIDTNYWKNVDYVVKDSSKLNFKDKSFDTITIIAALNHIPNRKAVLKECHRLLKDNGRVIITMIPPKIGKIWHFIRKPFDADQKMRKKKKGEVYGMTIKNIESLLSQTKFKIIKRKKFMFGINNLIISMKK